ncbi:MAG: type II toxin-antitoxin system VapC family toxin [Pseudomonadota bacterium]|nr:type II toxin-antitoxin system VapC family toxin [Pseudomonadota bacterium]MDP1905901.1 type II toxin-antitoxin system VapC family toxin [Pseudomonadota bacterium]MDP2351773.1 type II toxin-antitoxin system VapC family toxin [Pseudomonadota bacterium]
MTPRYLLDTNIVSDLVRHPSGPVVQRIAEVGAERIAISIIVACEIRFGLAKSGSRRLAENMEKVMAQIEVLPLEPPIEEHYAEIRATLERAGTPIGPNDLLIAAHARALGMILVSDNTDEFARVPGLRIENWLR